MASHSENYPLIDRPRFEVFVRKANLSGYMLSVEKSFKIFDKSGCGKDLNRPQFLKAILNLIYAKYLRPKAQEHIRTMVRRISSTVSNSKLQADYTISDLNSGARYIFERLIPKFASKRTW